MYVLFSSNVNVVVLMLCRSRKDGRPGANQMVRENICESQVSTIVLPGQGVEVMCAIVGGVTFQSKTEVLDAQLISIFP